MLSESLETTRYVTPLREGGSLPAIVEANNDGLYVVKFRGAGQGVKALVAEIIAGEIGRTLGLRVPELALIHLDEALGRAEPDSEIRGLLKASTGLNVAMDYLPRSMTFDPVAGPPPDAETASAIVWFDSFITNVDRTPKNPNLLQWHKNLWLIDHGAALYFHHDWSDAQSRAATPFAAISKHVLLPNASALETVSSGLSAKLNETELRRILALVPDAWLGTEAPFSSPAEHREAYLQYFLARLSAVPLFVDEAVRARSQLV